MTYDPLPQRPFCMIRHGETEANREEMIAGALETQLTARGLAQARKLAGYDWPSALVIFSSPQDRALETALQGFPGLEITPLAELRERNWGRLEGRNLSEMTPRDETPDQGEAWEDMILRVHQGVTRALLDPRKGLPVLVGHSGTIRATRRLTGGTEHGERAGNAVPLFFVPSPDGWREQETAPRSGA